MKTIYLVLLATSIALLVGMSALFVTAAATGRPIILGQSASTTGNRGGMMGGSGGGMMGGAYGSGNGYGSGMGGGMMGSIGTSFAGMMGGLNNGSSYVTRMMGNSYGNVSSWCLQYMEKYFGQITNSSKSGQVVVMIVNNAFYPANVTVPKGTTVTWINMDFVSHTVTSGSEQSPTNLFDSHELFSHAELQLHLRNFGRLSLLL